MEMKLDWYISLTVGTDVVGGWYGRASSETCCYPIGNDRPVQKIIPVSKSYLSPIHHIIPSFQNFRLKHCTKFTTDFLHLILLDMCTFHHSKNANYESPRYARFYNFLLLRVSYEIQTLSSTLHSKTSLIYQDYWGFVLCPLSGILYVIWNTGQSQNIQ
jgi:hypothetical protein